MITDSNDGNVVFITWLVTAIVLIIFCPSDRFQFYIILYSSSLDIQHFPKSFSYYGFSSLRTQDFASKCSLSATFLSYVSPISRYNNLFSPVYFKSPTYSISERPAGNLQKQIHLQSYNSMLSITLTSRFRKTPVALV